MQVFLILLGFLLPLLLHGSVVKLLPPGSDPLANWRFADWGERATSRNGIERKHTVQQQPGLLQVTLENIRSERSLNMMYRTIPLEPGERRQVSLRFKAASHLPGKALLRVQLNIPKLSNREYFFSIGKENELSKVETVIPKEAAALTVQFALAGAGKISLSEIEVEFTPKPHSFALEVPREPFSLPPRRPMVFPVRLPEELGRESFILHLTLPWGVRFINASPYSGVRQVQVKVREKSEFQLYFPKGAVPGNTVYLLLDSDLEPDEKLLSGSCFLESKGKKTAPAAFLLRTVKNLRAAPPRNLRIMWEGTERVSSLESSYDVDGALFRSGANVLVAPFLRIPAQTLKTARIQHYASLAMSPGRNVNRCYYQSLRDESFWDQHFLPVLRRTLLRNGGNKASALLCEPTLGQRRALECLCVLCRAELADFDSALPRRDVMTLSNGLLQARYRKALARFRFARLTALRESALIHLPKGEKGFNRSVRMVCVYPWRQILSTVAPFQEFPELIVDFQSGTPVQGSEECRSGVNYLLAQAVFQHARKLSPKSRLTAKFLLSAKNMAPEEMQFAIFNAFFAGFSGVWPVVEPGASYEWQESLGECAAFIREHENFFRRGKLREVPFKLIEGSFELPLPPVPGPGGYPLTLPRSMAGLQLKAWQYEDTLLLGVGNFSAEPRKCVLRYTGKEPIKKGTVSAAGNAELTVPPQSWKFLKFHR